MKFFNFKTWVYFYTTWLRKLGPRWFSLLIALVIFCVDVFLQRMLNNYFGENITLSDIFRSLILGLLFTPLASYFLTVMVDDMDAAQQKLNKTVRKLELSQLEDKKKNEALEKEIREREKSEQKVKEGVFLLKSFLNTSPDLVFHRDLEGKFVNCNSAMEIFTGMSEDQIMGMSPFDLFDEEYAKQVIERDSLVKDSLEVQIHEQWLAYPNGVKAFFEVHSLPLFNSENKCIGIIGFGRDITDRKKYEEELEKTSRNKTTFISTISHELRTPLNGIVGLSRMLLDDALTKSQRSHLNTIHMSAITLGNIFNDIIDLDKLDRKRLKVVNNSICLNEFVLDLENLAKIQTDQKGLELKMEVLSDLPNYIESDNTRLRQVLWNLISNAVKFTANGSITIRCFCEKLDEKETQLTFQVVDCGIGIPKNQLEKIFSMYYQVESKHSSTGTGIGLSVSERIAVAMKGTLSVKSKVNEGSTFTFSLTVPYSDEPQEEVFEVPSLSILLVEDIPLNTLVAKALLEKDAHRVDCAETGEEALEKVGARQYDLILMDIQLPDMTGFEVTARLRKKHGKKLPPIVALTANVFFDKSYFLENGLDDALGKPLSQKAMQKVFNHFFGKKNETISALEEGENNKTDGQDINEENEESIQLFNTAMISELLEFLPTSVMLSNVALFETMMPDYLKAIDSNITAKDKEGLVLEAHKVKSAASSIGLLRLQNVANQIQSPSLPAWKNNVEDWIELIRTEYKNDILKLKKWIVKNGK
jgi:two-component system aerobic respiration control sensor histidine kinase ArcB